MKVKQFLLMFVLSFGLIACSSSAPVTSATSRADGTETGFTSPTPWVGGTQTAQAVATQAALPSSEVTQVVIEKPADFSPVLYGGRLYDSTFFLLLGGVSRDVWLAPDMSVARFSGEATYGLHNMEYADKYYLRGKAPEYSPTCQTYSVGADADLDEGGFVATLDGWKVTQREVTELSPKSPVYQKEIADWLIREGISSPIVDNLRVLRVDIEGDGVHEVFLSAHHFKEETGHMTEMGDYSILLMRKVTGADVATLGIVNDVYRSQAPELTFPITYSLADFIDLNQDGNLEVVIEMDRWEGFGAAVFQINDREIVQTLRAFCAS